MIALLQEILQYIESEQKFLRELEVVTAVSHSKYLSIHEKITEAIDYLLNEIKSKVKQEPEIGQGPMISIDNQLKESLAQSIEHVTFPHPSNVSPHDGNLLSNVKSDLKIKQEPIEHDEVEVISPSSPDSYADNNSSIGKEESENDFATNSDSEDITWSPSHEGNTIDYTNTKPGQKKDKTDKNTTNGVTKFNSEIISSNWNDNNMTMVTNTAPPNSDHGSSIETTAPNQTTTKPFVSPPIERSLEKSEENDMQIDLTNKKSDLFPVSNRNSMTQQNQNKIGAPKRRRRKIKPKEPLVCEFCEREFKVAAHLREHVRIHTGERPFCCEICGKRFLRSTSLKIHQHHHTGVKPFKCSVCGSRFSEKSNLTAHLVIHQDEKPFSCDVCPKKFTRLCNLKTHKRVHTGEKPFHCDECPKRFADASNLKVHLLKHKRGKIQKRKSNRPTHKKLHYQCEVCIQKFTDPNDVIPHKLISTDETRFLCNLCVTGIDYSSSILQPCELQFNAETYSTDGQFIGDSSSTNSYISM